jgi:dolichyl-phosphate-mannose--protein O-mannosyl transferase
MIGPGLRPARGTETEGEALHVLEPRADAAAERARRRRLWGIGGVTVFLALVVVDFVWMWPIFTGGLRSYDVWHAHMWLPSWV